MDHHGGAKSGLVGEHAALESPCDSVFDCKTNGCAADCPETKCKGKDGAEHFPDFSDIHKEDNECAEYVRTSHKWDKFFRNLRDSLDAADDDESGKHHEQYSYNQGIQIDFGGADQNAAVEGADAEHGSNVAGNGVDLAHITDAERGEHAENGEQYGKYFPDPPTAFLRAETVPEIVHGATAPLVMAVLAAVIYAEHVFGVVCHHSEKRRQPHPEDCAGTSRCNRGCDSGNISDANRCGKRGTQSLEL